MLCRTRAVSPVPSSTAAKVMAYFNSGASVDQVLRPSKSHSPSPFGVRVVEGLPPPWGDPSSGSEAILLMRAPFETTSLKTLLLIESGHFLAIASVPTTI